MAAIRGSTIDAGEVERFAAIAADWWDESGAFRPLHRLNPARVEYVRDHLAAILSATSKRGRHSPGCICSISAAAAV